MSVGVGTSTALTPSVANFGGLKSAVASYVQGQNLPSVLSDSGVAINAAIDKINTRRWHWLNRVVDLNTVASTRTITLPADFKMPYALFVLDTSDNEQGRLAYLIPKMFHDSDFATTDGSPEAYTVRSASDDRALTFSCPPTAAWVATYPQVRLHYYARMLHFSDDGDTLDDLDVVPELRNFIVWHARSEMASIRGSQSQLAYADNRWKSEWVSLVADDNDEQSDWGNE